MNAEKIGAAIKVLRIKNGYTQHTLAECLDVTDKAVSKWERGLGVPDVSILAKLAIVLNTDIDNLLAGNVCWIEHSWRGILYIDPSLEISPGTEICGNPIISVPVSYFLLAGIKDICISSSPAYISAVRQFFGDGSRLGVSIRYFSSLNDIPLDSPAFFIRDYTFIYGPNLTKCFQLAIARQNSVSLIVSESLTGGGEERVSFDETRIILPEADKGSHFFKLPLMFIPEQFMPGFDAEQPERLISGAQAVAEPLGRGMISCRILSYAQLREIEPLVAFIQKNNGFLLYCPEEIAWRRGLINREQLKALSSLSDSEKGRYLQSIL